MLKLLKRSQIIPEALAAYENRLPDSISVSWRKEAGKFVGTVAIEENNFSFATQAADINSFIEKVNEGVIIAYDTPQDYIEPLLASHRFYPTEEALRTFSSSDQGKIQVQKEKVALA